MFTKGTSIGCTAPEIELSQGLDLETSGPVLTNKTQESLTPWPGKYRAEGWAEDHWVEAAHCFLPPGVSLSLQPSHWTQLMFVSL